MPILGDFLLNERVFLVEEYIRVGEIISALKEISKYDHLSLRHTQKLEELSSIANSPSIQENTRGFTSIVFEIMTLAYQAEETRFFRNLPVELSSDSINSESTQAYFARIKQYLRKGELFSLKALLSRRTTAVNFNLRVARFLVENIIDQILSLRKELIYCGKDTSGLESRYEFQIAELEKFFENAFDTEEYIESRALQEISRIKEEMQDQWLSEYKSVWKEKRKKIESQWEEENDQKRREAELQKEASDFVAERLDKLERRERGLKKTGFSWHIGGFALLILGMILPLWLFEKQASENNESLEFFVYNLLKGFILVGLLIAGSKYAFNLGKSFLNESIRTSNRRHAISFGEFYLKVYGSQVEKEDLKEVFKDWNTAEDSLFSKIQSSEYDPKLLKSLGSLMKNIKS